LLIVWLFAFIYYFLLKKRANRNLQKIRSEWGKQKTEYRNFDLIAAFSQLTPEITFHELTPQTIKDIDLHDLFAFVDRTNSKPGQQYLFNKLIKPTDDITVLQAFDKQVKFFFDNVKARENTQLLLSQLGHSDACYIASLLKNKLLVKPKWAKLLIIDTAAVIILLLLSFKFPALLIWLIPVFGINLFFHYWNKSNINKFIKSFPQLNKLILVSGSFLKRDLPFESKSVKTNISNLNGFRRKFKLLNFGEVGDNEIVQVLLLILELIKALFLVEIHSFSALLKNWKIKKRTLAVYSIMSEALMLLFQQPSCGPAYKAGPPRY
jgi:hypothetical protein